MVLQRLEYQRLTSLLAGQTQSEPGRLLAEALQPLEEQSAISVALAETGEAVELLEAGLAPSLGGCWDLQPILQEAQAQGALLPAEDLLKIAQSLQVTEACRIWFNSSARETSLGEVAAGIGSLNELSRRLREAIGSRGELLDSASFALGDLRYRIRQERSRIKQQLEQLLSAEQYSGFFQERLVTVRNGRYVVPLKSDCRGQLKGFVQDESASGQTLYLEPAAVLDSNNRLQQQLREEQREERRILLQLADLVRRDGQIMLVNQQLLARLDLRFAAGRLSRGYAGCCPQLSAEPVIELYQARHPLLMEQDGRFAPESAVAIDLLLPEECRVLVVSGPNTGGKSVALKTLGLLMLMVRSGLHIPCRPDSRLHLYPQLYVDIGDEQSIAESLSTFSGHLLRIREILEQADEETLVLLDEAGSGTDPAEGAALIQAVLEHLCRQGAKVMVTTHLGQLKLFAHSRPGFENVAVEFDPQTLVPTYRLRYGIPGASSAIETARRLGLPRKLLQQAVEYLGRNEQEHSELLVRLNARQQELDRELHEARKERILAEAEKQLRTRQLASLKDKKQEIIGRAVRQAEGLVTETEVRLKRLRKRKPGPVTPQEAVAQKQELTEAREALTPFRPKQRPGGTTPEGLQVGELVRISALGIEGQVERVSGDHIELQVGGKRLRQLLSALEQYAPRRFAETRDRPGRVSRQLVERTVSLQLKLVGRRVEDALDELQRYLDSAVLHNLAQVEIVHGSGTGALRRAIRDYLAGEKLVAAFYAAPAEQGGENVTIVELSGR